MIIECKECKIMFNKSNGQIRKSSNHFCSRKCAISFNRLKPKNPSKERKCASCESIFYRSREHRSYIFCSECVKDRDEQIEILKIRTISEYHSMDGVKNKHPSWKNAHIRSLNRSWNKTLTNLPCQKCGYNLHIELAHIKPISSFSESTTIGAINDPNNILALCRNCHWELDNGKIKIEDIPKRKNQL